MTSLPKSPPLYGDLVNSHLTTISTIPKEFGDSCPICTLDWAEGSTVVRTRCNHHFHKECLQMWLCSTVVGERNATCPLDRKILCSHVLIETRTSVLNNLGSQNRLNATAATLVLAALNHVNVAESSQLNWFIDIIPSLLNIVVPQFLQSVAWHGLEDVRDRLSRSAINAYIISNIVYLCGDCSRGPGMQMTPQVYTRLCRWLRTQLPVPIQSWSTEEVARCTRQTRLCMEASALFPRLSAKGTPEIATLVQRNSSGVEFNFCRGRGRSWNLGGDTSTYVVFQLERTHGRIDVRVHLRETFPGSLQEIGIIERESTGIIKLMDIDGCSVEITVRYLIGCLPPFLPPTLILPPRTYHSA
jgi:hypothetical protein